MPFPKDEILICNFPTDKLTKEVVSGLAPTAEERHARAEEARNNIFVYAGFIQPGKHQIMIRDKMTNTLWVREIVVDIRRRDIETQSAPNLYKRTNGIHKNVTSSGEEIIDLDGSVFMNFKRYTKQNIMDCLKADMATSIVENVLETEEEGDAIQDVLTQNYTGYCQFFHAISTQYGNFPNIALEDVTKVLD